MKELVPSDFKFLKSGKSLVLYIQMELEEIRHIYDWDKMTK